MAECIPMEQILLQMHARGLPVEWKYRLLSERNQSNSWTSGYFLSSKAKLEINLSREELQPFMREEIVESYMDVLTEAQQDALVIAQSQYRFSGSNTQNQEYKQLRINLVDVVCDLGGGLILDTENSRFYNCQEYRVHYAHLLNQQSNE
ncbi:hypothetical protein ACKFKH_21240 [Phormidesmis sp. 146-20]